MRIFKRAKEDKGASNTISFIMIIGFVMTLLISFIDIGIYFNTKNEIQTAAENGARNVALYGGTDNSLRNNRTQDGQNVTAPEQVVRDSIKTKYDTTVEQGDGTKQVVEVKEITCGPLTAGAGDTVDCKVKYKYNGIAGKFSLFNIGNKGDQVVYGKAVSEVNTDRN